MSRLQRERRRRLPAVDARQVPAEVRSEHANGDDEQTARSHGNPCGDGVPGERIADDRAGERGDERLDYLTRLILLECFSTSKKEDHANRIILEIAAWISANRDTPLKVSLVSKHFGYNADYLCRIFKAHFGKSLKEYLDKIKIDHVKQVLLTSNMSLKEVAYNTGFSDYKYFLKFFKYHEGITPTQFLKSYPKTHINKN